jgi:hypothetical protein
MRLTAKTVVVAGSGAFSAAAEPLTEGRADPNAHVAVAFPGAVTTGISADSDVHPRGADGDITATKHAITTPQHAARETLDEVEVDAGRVPGGGDPRLMDRKHRLSPRRASNLITRRTQELIK